MSLYTRLNELHGDIPWGTVLDAGTGRSSLRWLLDISSDRWTAVTGSPLMEERVRAEAGDRLRARDRIVLGNWMDPDLLAGEVYDHVLADYLLGAIEGFAPYWQDRLFGRLRPLVGKRLYLIGLEPYVPFPPQDEAGEFIVGIGRLRDACLLLTGGRPYREYPLDWVLRHLRAADFDVVDVLRLPIRYGPRFIDSQLDMCTRALNGLRDRTLALALQQQAAELRERAHAVCRQQGGLRHGHDYIVIAEPGRR